MKWYAFHKKPHNFPVISTHDEKQGIFHISRLVTDPTVGHRPLIMRKKAFSLGEMGGGVLLNTKGPGGTANFRQPLLSRLLIG